MFEGLPEKTTYAELLEFLKRDLRLDGTTDFLPDTLRAAVAINFPQLVTVANRKVNFGTATIVWGGASSYSGTVNIAHGLGVIPVVVLYTGRFMTATPFAATIFNNGTPDATNLQCAGYTPGVTPANTIGCVVYWLAIG